VEALGLLPDGLAKTLGAKYGLVKPGEGDPSGAAAAAGFSAEDLAGLRYVKPKGGSSIGATAAAGAGGDVPTSSAAAATTASGEEGDAGAGADNIQRQLLLQLMGFNEAGAAAGVSAGNAAAVEGAGTEALEGDVKSAAAEESKSARKGLLKADGMVVTPGSGAKGAASRQSSEGRDQRRVVGKGVGGEDRSLEDLAAAAAATGGAEGSYGGIAGTGTAAGLTTPAAHVAAELLLQQAVVQDWRLLFVAAVP